MNLLICDDEAAFGTKVERAAAAFFEERRLPVRCTVCRSGAEALARGDLAEYQVALLDVELEDMNGIALGRELKQRNPELVLVYISAYLEFAPDGYTVNAFRYILKPNLERALPQCLGEILAEQSRGGRTLPIRQGRTESEIPLEQIYYLESNLRKIDVYGDIRDTPLASYYGKLDELPKELFSNGFLRVGRSFVVNMRYIRSIAGYRVYLRNGAELGVTRSNYSAIRSAYLEWKGQYGND